MKTPPTAAGASAEPIDDLRCVYECARGMLRYEGVDGPRYAKYVRELRDAIERVKESDAGYGYAAQTGEGRAGAPAIEVRPGDKMAAFSFHRDLHPEAANLVATFAGALAAKLHAAQEKYGYSDGWMRDDWMVECRSKLVAHVAKGDPRDVAAYCAFLWYHGQHTTLPLSVPLPSPEDDATVRAPRVADNTMLLRGIAAYDRETGTQEIGRHQCPTCDAEALQAAYKAMIAAAESDK